MRKFGLCAVVMAGLAAASSAQTFIGPSDSAYLSRADSPWDTFAPGFTLLTFEDTQALPIGVGANGTVGHFGGLTDSVDADDGLIDGSGVSNGFLAHSMFSGDGASGITITFDKVLLSELPQRVGLAWTDGFGTITFEAFDADGNSLGTTSGQHSDDGFGSTTGEDRFYGIEFAGGVSKVNIRNSSGGIEIDHIQYGPVPAPGAVTVIGLAGLVAGRRRR